VIETKMRGIHGFKIFNHIRVKRLQNLTMSFDSIISKSMIFTGKVLDINSALYYSALACLKHLSNEKLDRCAQDGCRNMYVYMYKHDVIVGCGSF
jgi:hypothetical protein